jgi:hypothetical protein
MYELYKPLRNRLRTLSLLPSLMGVYRFTQFLQFDKSLPPELRYPGFGWTRPLNTGLHEWTLELIARELILNAPAAGQRAMTTWNEYAALGNIIRDIEGQAWARAPEEDRLIEYELVRIAHRQFPWQIRPNGRLIASYLKLYSNPRLSELMAEVYGMTAVEFFQVAMGLAGHFLDRPLLSQPVTNQLNAVPQAPIDRLVGRISATIPDLRARMVQMQVYNINWIYLFDPLRTCPIIDLGDGQLFCPMPTLLLWRLTEGVYFDLVPHRQLFDRHFGLAFQDRIGEVVQAADQADALRLLPEQRYGTKKRPRDSVDWIVEDDTAALFVECKASRLKAQAKVDLYDTSVIDGEVDRLAGFVVQVYDTMADAKRGDYPHWRPQERPTYPLVVTLDEWLPSGRSLIRRLEDKVREGLQSRGIPETVLEESPYTLCSLYEFEAAARAFSFAGVDAVMARKTAPEPHGWAMMPFLQSEFPRAVTESRVLFDAEWKAISRGLGA